jgi:hypothetical protein
MSRSEEIACVLATSPLIFRGKEILALSMAIASQEGSSVATPLEESKSQEIVLSSSERLNPGASDIKGSLKTHNPPNSDEGHSQPTPLMNGAKRCSIEGSLVPDVLNQFCSFGAAQNKSKSSRSIPVSPKQRNRSPRNSSGRGEPSNNDLPEMSQPMNRGERLSGEMLYEHHGLVFRQPARPHLPGRNSNRANSSIVNTPCEPKNTKENNASHKCESHKLEGPRSRLGSHSDPNIDSDAGLTRSQLEKLYSRLPYARQARKEANAAPDHVFEVAQKVHTTVTIKYRGVLYSWTMTDRQAWGDDQNVTNELIARIV